MNRLRLFFLLTGVYSLACCLILLAQFKEANRLRREQARMVPNIKEVMQLRNELASFSSASVDPEELDRLRSAHRELIKLRGKVASLRPFAAIDRIQVQAEIESLKREHTIEAQSAELLEARQRARGLSKETMLVLRTYVQTFHGASDGPFATSFEELERSVLENPQLPWFLRQNLEDLKTMSIGGDSVLDLFEILPEAVDARKYGNETLLLREKRARSRPDGGWIRAYATTGAKIFELVSDTTDFTVAESKYLDLRER